MKIFAVLTTNNEADILSDCLLSCIKWVDTVYVFDTGSTDSTPDILEFLSNKHPQIVYYRSEHRSYDFLRSNNEVFSHYFKYSSPGDWWCLLSTDEFYPEYVRLFLDKVPPVYDCIWDVRANFYFTDQDLKRFCSQFPGDLFADLPPMHTFYKTLRFYKADYSEPRFFRHTVSTSPRTLFTSHNFPHAWHDRILNLHYQYRYPSQILSRVLMRQSIFHDSGHLRVFHHEINFNRSTPATASLSSSKYNTLLTRIVDSSTLNHIDGQILSSSFSIEIAHNALPRMPISIQVLFYLLSDTLAHYFAKFRVAFTSRYDKYIRNQLTSLTSLGRQSPPHG